MPLEGVRMLDLSRYAPGHYCAMLLGDLGADVLMVEEPALGESRGPGMEEPLPLRLIREKPHLNALNRNKRSIVLNLKKEEGRQVLYRLAREADVLLEGYRPGVAKRLGIDYDTLRELNPRLVYCSLSGYGQDGPYAPLSGHDLNYIATAGALASIGHPETGPVVPINLLADYAGGGLHAAFAIVTALYARQSTGEGQYLDLSFTDGVLSLMAGTFVYYLTTGELPRPGRHMLTGGAPYYAVYEASDGRYISIGCVEPWFFANLCRALACEEFIPHQENSERYPEMFAAFRAKFKTKTRDEWIDLLRPQEVCIAPVHTLDEVLQDPQLRHRGMVVDLEHPDRGKATQVGIAAKLSATPGAVRSFAPAKGQHTDEVLMALGYAEGEVHRLRSEGVVA